MSEVTATAGDDDVVPGAPAPRWSRIVVAVLLVITAIAFVVPVKFTFWPITSWELFSRVRSGEQNSYRIFVVDAEGEESPMPWTQLGPGHRRWLRVAQTLPPSDAATRQRVCATWADAAVGALGPDAATEVRVYRVVVRAADDIDTPPSVVERDLYLSCEPS